MVGEKPEQRARLFERWLRGEGRGRRAGVVPPRVSQGGPRVQRLRRALRRALWLSRHRQEE
ncbi:MAG TPA: hypothetical protein EYH30_04960 [Anaerolineales bacterium]|nr:hypothetical protein [Anaerolineae bacterium]HIQ01463.1 hypothetical protein [Anaerolineales bacterium]